MVRTLLLSSVLLLAGCPKQPSTSGGTNALIGTWIDEGGAITKIDKVGGEPAVVSVVDYDGEVFVVQDTGVNDKQLFEWTYLVPSTGYVVHHEVHIMSGSTMTVHWNNSYDTGIETFTKQ